MPPFADASHALLPADAVPTTNPRRACIRTGTAPPQLAPLPPPRPHMPRLRPLTTLFITPGTRHPLPLLPLPRAHNNSGRSTRGGRLPVTSLRPVIPPALTPLRPLTHSFPGRCQIPRAGFSIFSCMIWLCYFFFLHNCLFFYPLHDILI